MDLRDVWRPGGGRSRLTWRMVQSFVELLPQESLTKTAARNNLTPEELAEATARSELEGFGPFSQLEMMVGAVYDRLGAIWSAIYGAQGGKAPLPPPYPRPGVGGDQERREVPQADRDWLLDMRERDRQARVAAGTDRGQLSPESMARLKEISAAREAQPGRG